MLVKVRCVLFTYLCVGTNIVGLGRTNKHSWLVCILTTLNLKLNWNTACESEKYRTKTGKLVVFLGKGQSKTDETC